MKIACMLTGHSWQPDPDSKETYPVFACLRCAKQRNMAGRAADTTMVVKRRNRSRG
jgi:hypothetical protein